MEHDYTNTKIFVALRPRCFTGATSLKARKTLTEDLDARAITIFFLQRGIRNKKKTANLGNEESSIR